VRIDHDRVAALDTGEELGPLGQAQRGAAIRRVDVQPQPGVGTDVGDRVQFVNRAGVRRAGAGDRGAHRTAGDPLAQRGSGEPPAFVTGDLHDIEIEQGGRLAH
jgi:hypothetical protein